MCAAAAQASRKPCVLVTASEGADAVAGKSGCSFAALPAHFGLDTVEVRLIRPPLSLTAARDDGSRMCLRVRAQGLDANIKTVHEQHTHVLTSLRLRFVSSPDLATPDKDVRISPLSVLCTPHT